MGLYNNKKAIAPLLVVLMILGFLIIVYLFLFLPIPKFTAIRFTINYWGMLLFFFAMQVGLIYIVYKIFYFVSKGYKDINKFVKTWQIKIRNYFIFKFQ